MAKIPSPFIGKRKRRIVYKGFTEISFTYFTKRTKDININRLSGEDDHFCIIADLHHLHHSHLW